MSWIIQTLLRNRVEIRSKQNIESDEYSDLMLIEAKVEELYKDGFLSDIDMTIINLVSDGKHIIDMEGTIGKDRVTISKTFVQICDRLAYFLGGYFTDDGFLENMKEDYKLSDDEIEKMRLYMNSRYKHKLMRKIEK